VTRIPGELRRFDQLEYFRCGNNTWQPNPSREESAASALAYARSLVSVESGRGFPELCAVLFFYSNMIASLPLVLIQPDPFQEDVMVKSAAY